MGYSSVTPYMCFKDAAFAIQFYKAAFGAKENSRLVAQGNKIVHAEINIAGTRVMLSDEHPQMGAISAESMGGSPIKLQIFVKDADAFFKKALAAGATQVRAVTNEFYGMRSGVISDPFGYAWFIAHQVENLTHRQIEKRFAKMMPSTGG